jgi:hypothetical protein
MPAKSKKQEKFMQAVANNPEFAKKVGVKQSVGKKFTKEKDMKKVKKMQMGGLELWPDKAGAQSNGPQNENGNGSSKTTSGYGKLKGDKLLWVA